MLRGPADRDTLIDHVGVDYDAAAYGDPAKADLKPCEHEIGRLREWGADLVVQAGHEYYLPYHATHWLRNFW